MFENALPAPRVRRRIGRRAMWAVVAGNVFATPIYFATVAPFVDPAFLFRPSFWLAVALAFAIAAAVIAAWWRDRAIGAAVQVIVFLPLIVTLRPLPLRAWRAFEPSVFLDWRAYVYMLTLVVVPGGLLAFTMVSLRRWVLSER